MDKEKESGIKKKIIEEMTIDYSNALEKNFDLAKQFIRITKDGKVDIPSKDKLVGTEQISLYLIGKLYAKEAGFIATNEVGTKELLEELGVPEGSLYPWLKELYDAKKIKRVKKGRSAYYIISVNLVEKSLKDIENKIIKKTG